jgi:hypothetical protein
LPEQFARFGGGDVFTLSGSIALSFIHPIAIILTSVFAVGFSASAVAGERQRGTLEVMLARPISRRTAYLTLLVATLTFVGIALVATLMGAIVGAAIGGVLDELAVDRLPPVEEHSLGALFEMILAGVEEGQVDRLLVVIAEGDREAAGERGQAGEGDACADFKGFHSWLGLQSGTETVFCEVLSLDIFTRPPLPPLAKGGRKWLGASRAFHRLKNGTGTERWGA